MTAPGALVEGVTGRVAPGTVGEVMIGVRGGMEAFYAYPVDGQEVIPIGAQIVVRANEIDSADLDSVIN